MSSSRSRNGDWSSTVCKFPDNERIANANPKGLTRRHGGSPRKRACYACCHKKVRCDIPSQGAPCANCQRGNVTCVAKMRYRRKKRRLANPSNDDFEKGDSAQIKQDNKMKSDVRIFGMAAEEGKQYCDSLSRFLCQRKSQLSDIESPGGRNYNQALGHMLKTMNVSANVDDLLFLDAIINDTSAESRDEGETFHAGKSGFDQIIWDQSRDPSLLRKEPLHLDDTDLASFDERDDWLTRRTTTSLVSNESDKFSNKDRPTQEEEYIRTAQANTLSRSMTEAQSFGELLQDIEEIWPRFP